MSITFKYESGRGHGEKWGGSVKSCIFLTMDINIQTLIVVVSVGYNAVFTAIVERVSDTHAGDW